jgi:cobalt-zinc-cadmium efflux system membrane fusion protein
MRTYLLLLTLMLACAQIAGCGNSDKSAADKHEDSGKHGEAEHAEGSGEERKGEGVTILAESAQAAGLEIKTAGAAEVSEALQLYGVVTPDAQRVRNVSARYAGVVLSVGKAVGDNVKAGETLATVESNDSLQTYRVLAPIGGVITVRSVNAGESVADATLFTVTDLSRVWVELSVFPRDLAQVRVGQNVDVKTLDGGLSGTGKVAMISSLGSTATQSLTARVVLDNADRRWAPGLYVLGEVRVTEAEVAVAVDSAALQLVEGRPSVFVVSGDEYSPRHVKLGRKDSEIAEILEGLEAGEKYVARNSFIVKAELAKGEAEHGH